MRAGRRLACAAVAAAMLITAGAAQAAGSPPCAVPKGATCGDLLVPLDRSGAVSGQLTVRFVRLAARSASKGTVVFVAGGPGQSAVAEAGRIFTTLAPLHAAFDLVVVDQRGSGQSSPLACSTAPKGVFRLSATASLEKVTAAVAKCAAELGPARALFSTYDTARDLDDLRRALGLERIIPLGVSYGGQVAGEYARRFPERTQALVLDSSSPIEGDDAMGRLTHLAVSRVLREVCFPPRCADTVGDPVKDLAALARKALVHPLRGTVVTPGGRAVRASLPAEALYALLRAADLDPFLRTDLPPALSAAAHGDLAPLLRLTALFGGSGSGGGETSDGIDEVRFLATVCTEGRLPWAPESDPATRVDALEAALKATPQDWAPFPAAAVAPLLTATECLGWPATPKPSQSGGAGPSVPVLVLAGREDLRTPLEDQRRTASQFPAASVIAVPNVGHSVLTTDTSGCALRALTEFLAAGPPEACPRTPHDPPLAPPFISRLAQLPTIEGVPAAAGRTAFAVQLTVLDALRTAASTATATRLGGLRGGTMAVSRTALRLTAYEFVGGVRVSGTIPARGPATLVVGGTGAVGTVKISESGRLSGVLGGAPVRAPAPQLGG